MFILQGNLPQIGSLELQLLQTLLNGLYRTLLLPPMSRPMASSLTRIFAVQMQGRGASAQIAGPDPNILTWKWEINEPQF